MSRRRSAVILIALLATILIAILHVLALKHGGGLWRDEVNGVNVANLPTLGEVYDHLPYESFPMLWPLILRGWMAVFGDSDAALRMLGALVGFGSLGAVWMAARLMGATAPVFCLGLFAMHPAVIRYGDSLRAYGLGAALLVLAVAAIWRIARRPARRNVIGGAVVIFLCAHCVYYNALFLLAAAMAMTILCARRRRWKPIGILAIIGVATALSGYPYLAPLREMATFNDLVRQPGYGAAQLFGAVRQTLDMPVKGMGVLWLMLALGAVFAGAMRVKRLRPRSEVVVYAAITLVVGLALYGAFLIQARYPAWATYFLVPMALAALCIDVALAAALRGRSQWALPAALVVMIALGASPAWRAAHVRMTNIDAVAAALNKWTTTNDLVIVMHWSTGVSFARYYGGEAPWTTLPPMRDHSVHRFDELKQRMADDDPVQPALLAMGRVLQAGGKVYLVRRTPPWPSDRDPLLLPPAPHPRAGWLASPYVTAWKSQLDYLVWQFVDRAGNAEVPDVGPVQPHESMWLGVLQGWREKPVR